MGRRCGLAAVVLLLGTAVAFSETVYLKNGDVISGTIVETRDESIVVETQQGKLEILKVNIDRIEYGEGERSWLKDKNNAIILRPLPTLVAGLLGYFEVVFEGQTAFSERWAVTSIGDIGSVEDLFVWSLQIGPQYRPFGEYLKGFLVGLYPGIGYVTDSVDMVWFFTLTLETGYQWVFPSGFVVGLTTGGSLFSANPYASLLKFNISAHLGFAFKDPRSRAK